MKIDGYVPPAKEVAYDQGVTFEYDLGEKIGVISITSKLAHRDNVHWRLAVENYQRWAERRKNLNSDGDDAEADRRWRGLNYDHLVIAWSTTIKSEGKPIEPTRENFIDLMMSDGCRKAFGVFMQDAQDEKQFVAVTEAELGNSPKSSRTGSNGPRTNSTGSET